MSEEQKIRDELYKKAKTVENKDQLMSFLTELETSPSTYGTIVYKMVAAQFAVFNMMNRTQGITGFQASFVGWEMIREYFNTGEDPVRLLKYKNLLYPQYEDHFHTISTDTWKYIQEEAAKNLSNDSVLCHPSVIAHWESIVGGKIPFGLMAKDT